MIAEMQADLVRAFGEQSANVGDDEERRGTAARVMGLEYLVQCVDRSAGIPGRCEFLGMSTVAVVGALRDLGALEPEGGQS